MNIHFLQETSSMMQKKPPAQDLILHRRPSFYLSVEEEVLIYKRYVSAACNTEHDVRLFRR